MYKSGKKIKPDRSPEVFMGAYIPFRCSQKDKDFIIDYIKKYNKNVRNTDAKLTASKLIRRLLNNFFVSENQKKQIRF